MLSSSRSLVAKLNVFELGVSASGNTTCEPVTLFLLSDSLEVARPRKRFTGEPVAHAIRAALAAVQGKSCLPYVFNLKWFSFNLNFIIQVSLCSGFT